MNSAEPSAIDYWHQFVTQEKDNVEDESLIVGAMGREPTSLISVVFERGCNFQCEHCFYQAERATPLDRDIYGLGGILKNLARQLPQNGGGKLLHAGRIMRRWHVEALCQIRNTCPQVKLGLIDSGHYTNLLDDLVKDGLRFEWLDISLDGTREAHNRQRGHSRAFDLAIDGLKHAREIVVPGGRVSSLLTLTTINYDCLVETANVALEQADEFHVSPIGPRVGQECLVVSIDQLGQAWQGLIRASQKHPARVLFRLYSSQEMGRLSEVVGKRKLQSSLEQALVVKDTAMLFLNVDGVRLYFSPPSLWPQEEILIDADGTYRTGYSGQYTLQELRRGQSDSLEDVRDYTVMQLDKDSDFRESYEKCVGRWWKFLGRKKFNEERKTFSSLKGGDNNAKH